MDSNARKNRKDADCANKALTSLTRLLAVQSAREAVAIDPTRISSTAPATAETSFEINCLSHSGKSPEVE